MELIKAAKKFLEIDDKIHSRSDNVLAAEIIADAEKYTQARKDLILAIRSNAFKNKMAKKAQGRVR